MPLLNDNNDILIYTFLWLINNINFLLSKHENIPNTNENGGNVCAKQHGSAFFLLLACGFVVMTMTGKQLRHVPSPYPSSHNKW